MGQLVQLAHEGADRLLVEHLEVAGPVVLVAQAPQDDRGVVAVLVDHRASMSRACWLVALAAEAAAAPGDLLPDQQAQLVAQVQRQARLLVVAEPDEVGAHLLDRGRARARTTSSVSGGAEAGVVLVAVGAAQQQALAVEEERALFLELEVAQAKALDDRARRGVAAAASPRRCRAPGRAGDQSAGLSMVGDSSCLGAAARHRPSPSRSSSGPLGPLIVHPHLDRIRASRRGSRARATPRPAPACRRLDLAVDVHARERDRRHLTQVDVAVEAAVEHEVAQARGDALEVAAVVAAGPRPGSRPWGLPRFSARATASVMSTVNSS